MRAKTDQALGVPEVHSVGHRHTQKRMSHHTRKKRLSLMSFPPELSP